MRGFLLLMLTIFSCMVLADEPKETHKASMVFTGFSYHMAKRQYWENTPHPKDYNEMNIGAGIQYDEYRLVVFQNSYYKTSVAVTWSPMWNVTDNLKAGFRLGAAVGYGDTPIHTPLAPVGGLEVDWKLGHIHNVFGTLGYDTLTYHIQVDF